jgi:hypothetical protein
VNPPFFSSLAALDDLTVTETEDGFEFSAPPETECGHWLGYWDSSPDLREEFSSLIKQILLDRLEDGSEN